MRGAERGRPHQRERESVFSEQRESKSVSITMRRIGFWVAIGGIYIDREEGHYGKDIPI
jgi:hypothetical protein